MDGQPGGSLLTEAVDYCHREFDHEPDALVHELVRGVLGAGYPSPPRVLPHIERILQRYLLTVVGSPFAPAGTYHLFATEGGAAGMAYLFRTLRENGLLGPGDKIAMATPVFTPYLQIPVLPTSASRSSSWPASRPPTASASRPSTSCGTRPSRPSSSSTPATPTAGPSRRPGSPSCASSSPTTDPT